MALLSLGCEGALDSIRTNVIKEARQRIKTHVNRQEKPAGYFAIFAAKIPDPQPTEIHTK